ncbi:hypothetical protein U14_00347 [Candidatus Moduliflexus flocculans]|uniref:Uncharacterized protein n=1 Tax=Candidatus Moduliflexus flocculans TaxID=1499966 RepID=A0A0S6VUA8_9BACT|nr:hypothetical protein U14_00347 [Candidatus Moduliflexus flocculans]
MGDKTKEARARHRPLTHLPHVEGNNMKHLTQRNPLFWAKYALVYVSGTCAWIMILKFYPRTSPPLMNQFGDSLIKRHGLVVPALLVFSALIIFHLVINFERVQGEIPGNKYKKGFVYGAWFGLIWIWGFIEYHHFFGSTVLYGFWAGLGDFIPFTLFGGLIGMLFGDSAQQPKKSASSGIHVIGLLIIPLFFAFGRYLMYRFTPIQTIPVNSTGILCEIGLAAAISVCWHYFREAFISPEKGITLNHEMSFIAVFWGINWALFNIYPLIKRDFPVFLIAAMILIDILTLALGIFFYKRFIWRKATALTT